MSNYKFINVTYLLEVADGDKTMISDIVELFKIQVPEFVTVMKEHLEFENFVDFKRILHKAKSAYSVLGISIVTERLKFMEDEHYTKNDITELSKFVEFFSDVSYSAIEEINLFLNNNKQTC